MGHRSKQLSFKIGVAKENSSDLGSLSFVFVCFFVAGWGGECVLKLVKTLLFSAKVNTRISQGSTSKQRNEIIQKTRRIQTEEKKYECCVLLFCLYIVIRAHTLNL